MNYGREDRKNNWKEKLREEFIIALTGSDIEIESAYIEIGKYYQTAAPQYLYKYYGDNLDRLETIKKNKMWYSAPCNFNDVFECEAAIDKDSIVEDIMRQILPAKMLSIKKNQKQSFDEEMYPAIENMKNVFQSLRETYGVTCFSEKDDSLLMWAHYANNNRGICVEYDLRKINQELHFTPIPIVYSKKRVIFDKFNLMNSENDTIRILIKSITTKSDEWTYENEWRIIREKQTCENDWDESRKGALLEMISPSAIILGCATTKEFENDVKEYCINKKIDLYKMEKDEWNYKLNKRAIHIFGKCRNK